MYLGVCVCVYVLLRKKEAPQSETCVFFRKAERVGSDFFSIICPYIEVPCPYTAWGKSTPTM